MVLAGKDGCIKKSGKKIGYIDNFSLNIEQGTAETSEFEDQWKTFIGTAKGFSGSFSGTFDYGDTYGQKAIVDELLDDGGEVSLDLKTNMALFLCARPRCPMPPSAERTETRSPYHSTFRVPVASQRRWPRLSSDRPATPSPWKRAPERPSTTPATVILRQHQARSMRMSSTSPKTLLSRL